MDAMGKIQTVGKLCRTQFLQQMNCKEKIELKVKPRDWKKKRYQSVVMCGPICILIQTSNLRKNNNKCSPDWLLIAVMMCVF